MGFVITALAGVIVGALITWAVTRAQTQSAPGTAAQAEMKLRVDDTFQLVQRMSAVFAGAGQRGRAGEFALENVLGAAGMTKHLDYETQVSLPERQRPDMIVNLPGRGKLVIDSKFPLDHFDRAAGAATDAERQAALDAYVKAVTAMIADLATRDYPSKIKDAVDFTVCFVPGDNLLATAYEHRPTLLNDAIASRILIATPMTLLALLWGVDYGWRQDARVQQAQAIGDIGVELHRRLGIMTGRLTKLGKTINSTAEAYNALLGSLEDRVLPYARRFESLDILPAGTELQEIRPVEAQARDVALGRYPAVDLESGPDTDLPAIQADGKSADPATLDAHAG
jgi:DNA recombination protein RmuC